VITEAEVTSMAAYGLQKEESVPLTEVQVYLREGKVRVTGSYRENGIALPMELIAEPVVSDDGIFRIELDSAKIGPISAPAVLRDRAQELLDEAVQQAMQEWW
jgi:uncharacterized protein YpmS